MKKTTESDSNYDGLDKMSVSELLLNINKEDKTVAHSVENQLPKIEKLVEAIIPKMKIGGRLFYICLLYTSPSPRDRQKSRMPSSA